MSTLKIDQDIQSMSDFRSGVAGYVKQVRETKRPLVITQHGKGVAVLLDAAEYDAMQEKIELLQAIHTAEQQLANGEGVDHDDALKQLLGKYDQ
jgi:antitoxin YefM